MRLPFRVVRRCRHVFAAIDRPGRRARRFAGMTLLEMMIVLAILALVMGLLVGPTVIGMFGESRVKIARIAAGKLAGEAYPRWQASHPDKACPDGIAELAPFTNHNNVTDPWGHPYRMSCGAALPRGAQGIAISSLGEDGQDGTDDDIRSWVDP